MWNKLPIHNHIINESLVNNAAMHMADLDITNNRELNAEVLNAFRNGQTKRD